MRFDPAHVPLRDRLMVQFARRMPSRAGSLNRRLDDRRLRRSVDRWAVARDAFDHIHRTHPRGNP